jgi:hypothetical protein
VTDCCTFQHPPGAEARSFIASHRGGWSRAPDGLGKPGVFGTYQALLGESVPLQRPGRLEFYATCRVPDLAVYVATGDNRLYANILLTVGYIPPSS